MKTKSILCIYLVSYLFSCVSDSKKQEDVISIDTISTIALSEEMEQDSIIHEPTLTLPKIPEDTNYTTEQGFIGSYEGHSVGNHSGDNLLCYSFNLDENGNYAGYFIDIRRYEEGNGTLLPTCSGFYIYKIEDISFNEEDSTFSFRTNEETQSAKIEVSRYDRHALCLTIHSIEHYLQKDNRNFYWLDYIYKHQNELGATKPVPVVNYQTTTRRAIKSTPHYLDGSMCPKCRLGVFRGGGYCDMCRVAAPDKVIDARERMEDAIRSNPELKSYYTCPYCGGGGCSQCNYMGVIMPSY
jgi:hypothetical protein